MEQILHILGLCSDSQTHLNAIGVLTTTNQVNLPQIKNYLSNIFKIVKNEGKIHSRRPTR